MVIYEHPWHELEVVYSGPKSYEFQLIFLKKADLDMPFICVSIFFLLYKLYNLTFIYTFQSIFLYNNICIISIS